MFSHLCRGYETLPYQERNFFSEQSVAMTFVTVVTLQIGLSEHSHNQIMPSRRSVGDNIVRVTFRLECQTRRVITFQHHYNASQPETGLTFLVFHPNIGCISWSLCCEYSNLEDLSHLPCWNAVTLPSTTNCQLPRFCSTSATVWGSAINLKQSSSLSGMIFSGVSTLRFHIFYIFSCSVKYPLTGCIESVLKTWAQARYWTCHNPYK